MTWRRIESMSLFDIPTDEKVNAFQKEINELAENIYKNQMLFGQTFLTIPEIGMPQVQDPYEIRLSYEGNLWCESPSYSATTKMEPKKKVKFHK